MILFQLRKNPSPTFFSFSLNPSLTPSSSHVTLFLFTAWYFSEAQELDIKIFTSINLGPKLIENITTLSFTFPWLSRARVPPDYSTFPLPSRWLLELALNGVLFLDSCAHAHTCSYYSLLARLIFPHFNYESPYGRDCPFFLSCKPSHLTQSAPNKDDMAFAFKRESDQSQFI